MIMFMVGLAATLYVVRVVYAVFVAWYLARPRRIRYTPFTEQSVVENARLHREHYERCKRLGLLAPEHYQ